MKWYILYNESKDKDFVIWDNVLEEYNGTGGKVVVPNGVEVIGQYCFDGNNDIEQVILPSSITGIGEYAFRDCDNLKRVIVKGKTDEEARELFTQFCPNEEYYPIDNLSIVRGNPNKTFVVRFKYSHRTDDEQEFDASSPEDARKKFEKWAAGTQDSEDFDFEFIDAEEEQQT